MDYLDYETLDDAKRFTLTLRACDSGGLCTSPDVPYVIHVQDENEKPFWLDDTSPLEDIQINENTAAGAALILDRSTSTISLMDFVGDPDENWGQTIFTISDSGALSHDGDCSTA